MSVKDYLKRTIKYICKGVPQYNIKVEIVQKKSNEIFKDKKILITGGGKRTRIFHSKEMYR